MSMLKLLNVLVVLLECIDLQSELEQTLILGGVNLRYYASILLLAFAFLLSNDFVGKINVSLILGLR